MIGDSQLLNILLIVFIGFHEIRLSFILVVFLCRTPPILGQSTIRPDNLSHSIISSPVDCLVKVKGEEGSTVIKYCIHTSGRQQYFENSVFLLPIFNLVTHV